MEQFSYCFDCDELAFATPNKKGVYESVTLAKCNHMGHHQHTFTNPQDYSPPICNALMKLEKGLSISHNEMILFKLAIDLGELDRFREKGKRNDVPRSSKEN
jgi:hypothetical protein